MKAKSLNRSLVTIGKLSKLSGISRFTLRYYTEQGLLLVEERTGANYRLFDREIALKQIDFIKKAQRINFSLDEIKSLLSVEGANSPCNKVRSLLNQKIAEIDQRIDEFERMKSFLSGVQTKWLRTKDCDFAEADSYSICRLVEDLES
jgi:DNA-binding transcriptional MerR regulator